MHVNAAYAKKRLFVRTMSQRLVISQAKCAHSSPKRGQAPAMIARKTILAPGSIDNPSRTKAARRSHMVSAYATVPRIKNLRLPHAISRSVATFPASSGIHNLHPLRVTSSRRTTAVGRRRRDQDCHGPARAVVGYACAEALSKRARVPAAATIKVTM